MRIAMPVALLFTLGLAAAPAVAFHDGGVASCEGCHVTHNSVDGVSVVPGPGNEYSLKAGSASDVCLICHATSAGAVLGLNPLAPPPEIGGGNFVFLFENNLNDADGGGASPISGQAAGHNVVAPAFGLFQENRYSFAPGGVFPVAELGCTSCHDPHGRDTFRLLHGAGEVQGGVTFTAGAPNASGLELAPGELEVPTRHTAYRSGMTAWCSNCHGRYHEGLGATFEHPIDDPLSIAVVEQYNKYDGVNNPTGGTSLTAYLPEVPFEDPNAAVGSTAGPTFSSRVSCMSCHRAHATSAPAAGRWDFAVATLGDDGVASGSWPIPNPYDDPSQPGLCWKCHTGGAPAPTP